MNSVERPTIVLVLPGFDRQRLSNIGRGWCPLFRPEMLSLGKRGGPFRRREAHRLS